MCLLCNCLPSIEIILKIKPSLYKSKLASFIFLSLTGLFFFQGNYSKEISLGIVISILALFSSIFSIRSEYIHPSWKFYTTYSEYKLTKSNFKEYKIEKYENKKLLIRKIKIHQIFHDSQPTNDYIFYLSCLFLQI